MAAVLIVYGSSNKINFKIIKQPPELLIDVSDMSEMKWSSPYFSAYISAFIII